MRMLPAGILIVTHNSAGHIGRCLDAVEKWRGPDDRVLVVDNCSSDETVSEVQKRVALALIVSHENLGFAGAVNLGFRHFGDSVGRVLLLNPDVVLTTSFTALGDGCNRHGLATGRLVDEAGSTQSGFSIRRFPTAAALVLETLGVNRLFPGNRVNRSYRYLDFDYKQMTIVEQPAGALLMVRTDVWASLGGFDEEFYPVWFEDVDFCQRAQQANWRAAYIPSVEGIHAGGHSVNIVPEMQRRLHWYASLLRYSRKHHRGLGRQLVGGGVVIAGLARSAAAVLQTSGGSARNWMKVAHLGWTSCVSGPIRPGESMNCPVLTEEQRLTTDAAYGRGDGGVVDSSAIKNTERSLKRLHAR